MLAILLTRLRRQLNQLGIVDWFPVRPSGETSVAISQGFEYHGDHLICPEGKRLVQGTFYPEHNVYQYAPKQNDCQACLRKSSCLTPGVKKRYLQLGAYYPEFLLSRERNKTEEYRREMKRRKTIIEGIFASLDRLGWIRSKLRGLQKVNCEGFLAALAHNILKSVRKFRAGMSNIVESIAGRKDMEEIMTG